MEYPLKIAIIDDNVDFVTGLHRLLKKEGFEIHYAYTGPEGLRMVDQHRPDLLLLDMIMPGMDGLEVFRQIRNNPRHDTMLIVYLSGSSLSSDTMADALNTGADGYITRPLPTRELLARIHSYIRLKKSEKALRESEARLAAFMKHVPALILIKDVDSRPVYANKNFTEYFQFEENIGHVPHETLPVDIADNIVNTDQEALKKGYISYEENWTGKDGLDRVYNTQKFVIDVPGSAPLIGVISSDITKNKETENILNEKLVELLKSIDELKEARSATNNLLEDLSVEIEKRKTIEDEILLLNQHLEDRVKERTEQLEASIKEIESFSYSVSHDLRTPLRALNGFASLLIEDYSTALDAEGIRMLSIITENANRMGKLIDDLLEFSKLSRYEVKYLPIDMVRMVHEVIEELVPGKKRRPILFTVQPLPGVSGDPSMIRQVWRNLISNAIKFSSGTPDPRIEIGYSTENNYPCFFIKDNGVGFDPEFKEKLFGVFQRLHGATEFEGTGVGLAIVQRIVHRHGGHIWAESEVGVGSTFFFSLNGEQG